MQKIMMFFFEESFKLFFSLVKLSIDKWITNFELIIHLPIESWTDPSNWSLLIYLSRFIFHSSLRFPSNKRKPMQTFIIDQFDSENWTQGNEKERSDLSRGCIDIVTRNTPHSRRRRIAHRCTRHCYGERIVTPYIHIVFSNENLVGFVEACLLFFFQTYLLSPLRNRSLRFFAFLISG